MKILVIGSGGREHALVWRLRQSPEVTKIWCAPGNGGIAAEAECVPVSADDVEGLVALACCFAALCWIADFQDADRTKLGAPYNAGA